MSGLLITNAHAVTWGRPNEIVADAAVLLRDGRIAELGPATALLARHPEAQRIDARGQYLMPGNVSAHGHFYGTLIRGMGIPGAPPSSLPGILERLWWPFDKALTEEDVRLSALVAAVDCIRHGTTTLFDHHSSPNFIEGALDTIAGAVDEAGLRAVLCFEVTDRDGDGRAERGIAENLRFLERCAREPVADGRIAASFGIHASMTVSERTLARCRELAPANAGFHVHVAEHEYDQERSVELAGRRAVERLDAHGLLSERSIAAHAIHIDEREIELLASSGAWVAHQPRSNLNVIGGIADVDALLAAGVPVCIGTDGLSHTMWKEWEFAHGVQKLKHGDASRLGADRVAELGMRNNAALASTYFPGAPLGVIEPGAAADLVLVDYQPPTPLTPENLPWHLLFGFNESMVTTTIVDGRVLMRDRELLTLDEAAIAARARAAAASLWERYRGLVPTQGEHGTR
jgi:putative selenium metabolism protein SsnA